jgi:hypothetical protein
MHGAEWLQSPLDLSYGVHLYAFPVQQVSAMLFTNFWLVLAFLYGRHICIGHVVSGFSLSDMH